ncbi:putative C2H2 finger domain protein [Aspergillus mulundensis]|uniref:Uncharacterized protein n=1 Tax=Aspergillus mulundensis TaxID=1810919 RepID=A0A3D8QHZ2_9EURO|nr:Uncharacterized protein DSM5745_10778 [Aspergillus mulundensis]RDW61280.1 Uncharacterized protein DSM5745_10778 [Aspergillus mulundensis]
MGQSQSTAQSGTATAAKKDYYELLEIEQNASSEEIKKAYRRKALDLHPDRNFGNVEAATNLFAEIQSAYEVLSDPHERSWYDSHRDAFLGGGGDCSVSDTADILKLFSKFSPRMEFSDALNGFYGGLRETFAQLALEEETAGCDFKYPSFGFRNDENVRDFYATWSSFSTKKSFSWKDAYRYSEAPDRRVRRMMEKENKRLREGAVREYNDAVRSLVAFVKKRDPRYKSYRDGLTQQREALRQSAASQATRSRAANQARLRDHVLQDWARPEEPEENEAESSDEGETEHIECIACRKTFKSQNQFQAHERSKKHIKAVKQLRREMKMQHDELDLGSGELQKPDDLRADDPYPALPDEDDETHEGDEPVADPSPASVNLPDQDGETRGDGPADPNSASDSADYVPRDVLKQRISSPTPDSVDGLLQKLSASDLRDRVTPKKIGKAKQKRAKKAQLLHESQMECSLCNASFASRNKLFSHIKSHHQR